VYISIFGNDIPMYGILFFLGIFISVILAIIFVKQSKISLFDFFSAVAFILIGAIIGAKALFIIASIDLIVELQLSFMEVMRGGFVFYGGLIGGALGLWLYCKFFKMSMRKLCPICSTVLPLGHAIGRIGCFFAGCCYGIEYHGALSYTYTQSINIFTPIGVPLLPIQLIESFILLLIFAICLIFYLKNRESYLSSIVYSISYAVVRFVLEFFRGDGERGGVLGLSTSQWISILIVLFIVSLIIIHKRRNFDNAIKKS